MIDIPLNDESILSITDNVDDDGYVEIEIEDFVYCQVTSFWIDEPKAIKIIEHLEKVFELKRNNKTQKTGETK